MSSDLRNEIVSNLPRWDRKALDRARVSRLLLNRPPVCKKLRRRSRLTDHAMARVLVVETATALVVRRGATDVLRTITESTSLPSELLRLASHGPRLAIRKQISLLLQHRQLSILPRTIRIPVEMARVYWSRARIVGRP